MSGASERKWPPREAPKKAADHNAPRCENSAADAALAADEAKKETAKTGTKLPWQLGGTFSWS